MSKQWVNKAEELIEEAAGMAIENEERLDMVLDRFIEWADDQIKKGPVVEVVSDFLLRRALKPLVHALIESTYQRLKAEGRA